MAKELTPEQEKTLDLIAKYCIRRLKRHFKGNSQKIADFAFKMHTQEGLPVSMFFDIYKRKKTEQYLQKFVDLGILIDERK